MATILAHQNRWNTFGTTPAETEFNLTSSITGDPIFVGTGSIGAGPCGAADPDYPIVDLPDAGGTYLPSVSIEGLGIAMRLDSALSYANGLGLIHNPLGNDFEAIEAYSNIIMHPFDPAEIDEGGIRYYLDLAYNNMKQTLYHAVADSTILLANNNNAFSAPVQRYVDVLNHLTSSDTITAIEYVNQFYLELDKAHLMRSLGYTEIGLDILKNINLCAVDSSEQVALIHWLKYYNSEVIKQGLGNDIAFRDSIYADTSDYLIPIDIQLMETYFGSVIMSPTSIIYKTCGGSMMPKQEEETDELAVGLKVYPNPSRGLVNVSYSLPDESYVACPFFQLRDVLLVIMTFKKVCTQIHLTFRICQRIFISMK
ncbi:MAG: hypothetical protein ACPG21_05000 [Crocinitomicaceae bacterium]